MKTQSSLITKEQRREMTDDLKSFFLDELDMELSDMQVGFLVDFLSQNLSKYFYNRGVVDTMNALKDKTEDLLLLLKD
jgi:uncharacterized protein (DUF2164 family)